MSTQGRRAIDWGYIAHINDWPIAVKITVLCTAIAIVLAATLTAIGYSRTAAGLSEQANKEIKADAQLVQTTIDDWHRERLAVLALGAVTPAVVRVAEEGDAPNATDHAGALAVLGSIAQRNPDIQTVGIMDSRGTFLLDVDPASVGESGPQYDFFQQAMQGREFISGVRISGVTGKPALYHSVPIRNAAGDVVGVLRARSSLSTVTDTVLAATDRLGFNADGALLDANGLVIANTLDDDWLLRPAVTLAPAVQTSLVNGSVWGLDVAPPPALGDTELASAIGVTQPTSFDWTTTGAYYHALAMPLTQTDWTYVAALPFDTFEAASRDLLQLAVVAALVGVGVAFAAGALIAQHLSRPLLHLTSATRLMADSQLSDEQATALAETPDDDEIGQLSRVFGRMAREVIQREVGLRSQVQVLTVMIDEAKRGREVAEITESEYFQSLAQRSKEIRARRPPKLSA
jgi:C4-dicarboxylate-specific signal transduction histidine kinase